MLKLEIPTWIFEQMLEQSRAEAPIEACGILAGRNGKAKRLYKMTNADKSSVDFMMKPKEQFRVAKDIRSEGLEMLAIYHSHPEAAAWPSAKDIQLALTPEVTYVIVSLQASNHPVVRGFSIENSDIAEVPIEIIKH
ncbi:MAG: M67 family metallopeptidase [Planctomycetota bacterium]|jgi:proteasome lid subunit RPN8/RPN11